MVLGIILSVGILSAALNLFEGYERALKEVLLDSFPHVRIQDVGGGYLGPATVSQTVAWLEGRPEVASSSPVLSFSLMAYKGDRVRGSVLRAYEAGPAGQESISKYISEGSARPQSGEVVVGHYLARELGLSLGDTLSVVYPRLDRITPLGMYPNQHSFVIAGLYRSGYYEYDRTLIISGMEDARSILGISLGVSGIEVRLKGAYLDEASRYAAAWEQELDRSLYAAPVANTTLLRLVRMQKWLIFIIFSFLVLIAGINVISSVLTLIYDKKNEIAVLKALGAGPATVRNILGHQLTLVCLASIILGQLFGWLLSWLVVKQNFYRLKGDVYFIDRLELFVSPFNQALTFAVAGILVLLCIRIPLRRIDQMQVIDLLRNT
ncbi:MAG: ABC transporter permease [Candidatus Syntrophosphaera sp.]|nr:ABC transporter permease [Candidatus Syntrophosphaera sp.]